MEFHKKLCGCLLVILIFTGISKAENFKKLSIDEAISIAINNNSEFKSYKQTEKIYEAKVQTASALKNPAITSDSGIAENTYRVGIEQTIELGSKRAKRKTIAELETIIQKNKIQIKLLDLIFEVGKAYNNLYYEQQTIKALKDILKTLETVHSIAVKREKYGDIPKTEVMATEMELLKTENDFEKAVYRLNEANIQLSYLLNTSIDNDIMLDAPVDDFNNRILNIDSYTLVVPDTNMKDGDVLKQENTLEIIQSLFKLAVNNRQEFKEIGFKKQLSEEQLKLAKKERIPNFNIGVGADIVTGNDGKTNAYITSILEIPILNWQKGPINEAIATKNQVESEKLALESKVKSEVEKAYFEYKLNKKIVKNFENSLLPKTNNLLEKSTKSYELGKTAVLNAINAQQNYMQMKLGYLQAQKDLQNSITNIKRIAGVQI